MKLCLDKNSAMSGDIRVKDASGNQQKSRIPQRVVTSGSPRGRQRYPYKPRVNINETMKNKVESAPSPALPSRPSVKNTRPRSCETRPWSANKKEEQVQMDPALRPQRIERERLLSQKKVLPTSPKRNTNEKLKEVAANRGLRPIITVPKQKIQSRIPYINRTSTILPDQETIKRCEELEANDDFGESFDVDGSNENFSYNDEESLTSRSEKLVKLKMNWQEKVVQFEKMKSELNDRQNDILQVYASMRVAHQELLKLGQKAILPTTEDLKVMNVAKMTPAQLLQLCEETRRQKNDTQVIIKDSLTIDMTKLNNIPAKLVETSELILTQQREFTKWFQNVISQEKECSIRALSKKINEFNAENEMLNGLLHTSQNEFLKEINYNMDFLRKCVNEAISNQLRNEKLTCEVSELNSKIVDLRKQLTNAEQQKSFNNKYKIEELEKDLKEQKMKCKSLRDRAFRADGQVKMEAERSANLEAALNQSRVHTRDLERTILQLKEQNERLQSDFDTELNKLNESIQENSVHLEEIADAREKLQAEKEDLEKRLEILSIHYNESISKLKHELGVKVTQLIETEKNNLIEVEEKKKLQGTVEVQCTKLLEAELQHKELMKRIEEYEEELNKSRERESKLEAAREELDRVKTEMEQYKHRLLEKVEIMKEIEIKFKESRGYEVKLKNDLKTKNDYITALERKQMNLEEKLRESESEMESYKEQLTTLKNHIMELQEYFGDVENINDLRDMLNEQKHKMEVITRENHELAQTLQKRKIDLELLMEKNVNHEHEIKQRDDIIKVLSQKEEEQANIIKLLRNNFEHRSKIDSDLSRQITEKNEEIDVLINNLETRKGQISQLEKIILTLEDQMRKASQQKRKDNEKIEQLERKFEEYKTYIETKNNVPSKNLDSLFEILEDELGNSFEQQFKLNDSHKNKKTKHNIMNDRSTIPICRAKHQLILNEPNEAHTTILVGDFHHENFPKKDNQVRKDLNRKKANVETFKWAADCNRNSLNIPPCSGEEAFTTIKESATEKHEKYITRNLQLLVPDNYRDDRKYKQLKLTSHRI
ncbi:myosin-13-like isoform X1 [Pieris napi]|uniref:myosin-13-like isoform X1 n=1 Tax=Pieris napi TaxID=78633 RepID=UPI001FBB25A6|nr:myosin-13-like isoform X1 [Pieris napi]